MTASPLAHRLLDLATLAVYAFGALTFSVLSVYYWRERLRRRKMRLHRTRFSMVQLQHSWLRAPHLLWPRLLAI